MGRAYKGSDKQTNFGYYNILIDIYIYTVYKLRLLFILRKFLYTIYFEYETTIEYFIDIRISGKLLPLDLKPADINIFFILIMNIHKMNIQYIIF
jgi:hypothetical protein